MQLELKEEKPGFLQNLLVATKLFIPALPARLIPRLRLIDKLDQGLGCRLTLVSALAGFGKTTLLAKWLQLQKQTGAPQVNQSNSAVDCFTMAWVSLEESDNEPALFWKYVLTALEQAQPGLGAPLVDQLLAVADQPLQPILTHLINRVLDYYQP